MFFEQDVAESIEAILCRRQQRQDASDAEWDYEFDAVLLEDCRTWMSQAHGIDSV